MSKMIFELPEKLAAQITAMPSDELNEWATEVLQNALDKEELSDDEITAIKVRCPPTST